LRNSLYLWIFYDFTFKVSQDHLLGSLVKYIIRKDGNFPVSGIAIPQFVIDSPGGYGKIPILPNYILYQTPEKVVLRNFEGKVVEYPEV
jgi:L-lysine 2,3-aminomutase